MEIKIINDIKVLVADEGKGIINKNYIPVDENDEAYKAKEIWLGISDNEDNYQEVDL